MIGIDTFLSEDAIAYDHRRYAMKISKGRGILFIKFLPVLAVDEM